MKIPILHSCRALALAVCLTAFPANGDIPLAGTWRFQLDRDDSGLSGRWFDQVLPGSIQLPGALQNQGLGDDISADTQWTGGSGVEQWLKLPKYERYRQPGNIKIPFFLQPEKHYVGVAWYQRDIEIPEGWKGRRVVLTLERAHWGTQAWLDDKPLGSNTSLSTPHVYDLGVGLTPGKHRLTIRVDNRLLVAVGARAHSVSDETQGNWNGIVGEMKLSTTSPVWIEDAQAYPDISKKSVLVKVKIGNAPGKAGEGTLKVGDVSQKVEWTKDGGMAELEIPLGKDAKLWDEFTPALQRLTVKLTGDGADDERHLVFGLREIGVDGRQFVVNGRPTFFRGTLECCIFPLTGYPPTDVESWKRIIRICQAHGLNHMRFHSWCPPEAAFVAADELGFYLSVEIAAWATVGDGQPLDQWLYDEAGRVLKAYGNHPSFVMMPYGNEPSGKNRDRWLGDWVNHWKQTDSRHLYTSASGWPAIPENQYHVTGNARGPRGWLGLDYQNILDDVKNFRGTVENMDVPVIVHEMGQWCVYPNFDEMKKYTGPLKPKNFEIFRESLKEHGMLDQANDFFMASGKLQALCYKEDIEAALRTPGFGGVQLLDLHDFPGQGTALVGVLDPFWDSKPYINAAEYRRFYNSTVPLARLLRNTWASNETFTADVEVAHFGATPLENAQPYWKVLAADGHQVAGGEFPAQTIPIGHGTKLGKASVTLEKMPSPAKYKLVVGLKGTEFENDWNFWVYPSGSPAAPANVLVATSFDEEVRMRLADGGKVFLASNQIGIGNPMLTFQPVFWNRFMNHKQPRQTLGLLCNPKHPALAQFPTDYFQDWQWYDIVTEARAVVLDGMPRDLRPIVQPIDDWNTNRRLGLVFECRVGKGKLLVCAADLSKDLEHRPAARQLRDSLLAYVASKEFNPKVEIPEATLADILARTKPSTLVKLGAKVIACDSQADAFPVSNALDGNPDTFWHTRYGKIADPMPHHLVIDLGREMEVSGIKYLPRQDQSAGRCVDSKVFCSNDPKSWGEATATVRWENNDQWQTLDFGKPIKARYLKLLIKSEVNDHPFSSVAELDIIQP
ncbi:MAG: glycoside hydrolase [Verrucomicrobiaceae bacterium]|nr:MAG: glycoside hydrolase [Verrucomicrobiaceae bacterium]